MSSRGASTGKSRRQRPGSAFATKLVAIGGLAWLAILALPAGADFAVR